MAERAVFLDRDDTIIDNDGYLGDPSKVKLLPGAAAALAALRALGYRLIVVTNQSGVARGMFDEAAVQAVNNEMSRQLREAAGTFVDASYYCPFHPEATVPQYRSEHEWRKPKPGMLKQAAVDFRLDLSQCWMVGDMDRDIGAGVAAGCRTILLDNPDLGRNRGEKRTVEPTFVCKTLADAARIIAREGKSPPPVMLPALERPVAEPRRDASATTVAPTPEARHAPRAEGPSQESGDTASRTAASTLPATESRVSPEKRLDIPAREVAPRGGGNNGSSTAEREAQSRPAAEASAPIPGVLEHRLDELIIQLRQQNRHADLRPDFSLPNMGAMIVQALALVMFLLGVAKLLTLKATFAIPEDYFRTMIAALQAVAWLCGAMVLQGVVIVLVVHARGK